MPTMKPQHEVKTAHELSTARPIVALVTNSSAWKCDQLFGPPLPGPTQTGHYSKGSWPYSVVAERNRAAFANPRGTKCSELLTHSFPGTRRVLEAHERQISVLSFQLRGLCVDYSADTSNPRYNSVFEDRRMVHTLKLSERSITVIGAHITDINVISSGYYGCKNIHWVKLNYYRKKRDVTSGGTHLYHLIKTSSSQNVKVNTPIVTRARLILWMFLRLVTLTC